MTTFTDLERVALTMLSETDVSYNQPLQNHIDALVNNPDHMEFLNDTAFHDIEYQRLSHDGLKMWQWRKHIRIHQAVANLCVAIVLFRRNNRMDEQTTNIGYGFALQTSLSAAIVQFHTEILNCTISGLEEKQQEAVYA